MKLVINIDIEGENNIGNIAVYNAEKLYDIILHNASNFLKNGKKINIYRVVGDKKYSLANIGLVSGNYLELYINNNNNNNTKVYTIDDRFEELKDEIIEILDRNYFQKSRRIKYALIATVILAAIGTGGYFIFR